MTDQELLELAAKASGIALLRSRLHDPMWRDMLLAKATSENGRHGWNPLTDDGDALRLAVKLEMQVCIGFRRIDVVIVGDEDLFRGTEVKDGEPNKATRRAIVRAAAELGKSL